jgi:glycosyltransferase involved in cell wall biosynthesis
VDISIITPSFNMLSYLKLCHASIADQEGPSREHIVVDGVSTDGTVEWLTTQPQITSIVEKDNGMYDAINKGFDACSGEIVSYLSCDEQYLPGTLKYIHEYFQRNPDVDGVFGDTLIIRPDGDFVSFRKSYRPFWPFIGVSILYVFPASMFLRRRILDNGVRFDTRFKARGDGDFVIRLLRKGYRLRNIRRYLSTFAFTGHNLGQSDAARSEDYLLRSTLPAWVPRMRRPLNAARLLVKLLSGAYFERPPLNYSVYVPGNERARVSFQARHLSQRWPAP